MKTSLGAVFQVWYDQTGEHIDVSEDLDGLELVRLAWSVSPAEPDVCQVLVQREHVQKLIEALLAYRSGQELVICHENGETLIVREDEDGLDMIEIGWVDKEKEGDRFSTSAFSVPSDVIKPLVQTLVLYMAFLQQKPILEAD